jgi:hypothetical protein
MLFYAQKLPKKDLFAHASQYCRVLTTSMRVDAMRQRPVQRGVSNDV